MATSGTLQVPPPHPQDEGCGGAMGYQQTLMYGRYSQALGEQLKQEQRLLEKNRRKEDRKRKRELSGGRGELYQRFAKVVTFIWKQTFARMGEDWVFLALLGIIMALVSFAMDFTISACNQARLWLVKDLVSNVWLQFLAWTSLSIVLVLFSAGFVHVVAPQAIGSGIPEMKTILRGVVLKEYLTFRTLVAKVVGLTATLGSGMPLGKEGPFVHIASIVATLLTKLVVSFQGIYANESRSNEMLAAACAVGVACCFGSPIGGVLFSIEVTSVYFAVRNYWRGFFAAVCGAVVFRLLSIWFEEEETIVAVFRTGFSMDFPYDPQELFVFSLIGIVCGLGGALYVYLHRRYVLWMRGNKQLTSFLQKNRFIYPFFISFLISALTFPPGPGMFQAADITTHEQIEILFSNYTWARDSQEMTVDEFNHVKHWIDPYTKSIFVNLAVYIFSTFFLSIIASTLPVPTGVLIPSFKVGAAFGRMVGEGLHLWFPEGVRYGDQMSPIMPGGYATVGAAAFSGAVTHTISISVIVFEMTGQVTHCVPVLIAVIISNCVASLLQPSCYDSIIMIKKLPYLPDIIPSSSGAYNIFVESFMMKDVKYIWYGMTYRELRDILKEGIKFRGFPLVDSKDNMILIGSVQKPELIQAVERQISRERRLAEAAFRRQKIDQQEEEERQRLEAQRMLEDLVREDTTREQEQSKPRRPSRFEVSTVDEGAGRLRLASLSSPAMRALAKMGSLPRKSILKGTNKETLLTVHGTGQQVSPLPSPYQTFSGPSEKWRNTVQNMQDMFRRGSSWTVGQGRSRDIMADSPLARKKHLWVDLTLEEQHEWEAQEMEKCVNFSQLQIDPAPFQLVEKSSLLKVHSLFSMLGVNHAYVTAIGRLKGVVGLTELRKAIEDANSGLKTQPVEESKPAVEAAKSSMDTPPQSEDFAAISPSHSTVVSIESVAAAATDNTQAEDLLSR